MSKDMTSELISLIERYILPDVNEDFKPMVLVAFQHMKEQAHYAAIGRKKDWLLVKPETMPEPGEKVLILHMGVICEAINSLYEDHKSFYIELTDEIVPYSEVTHWMKKPPLPALPGQEKWYKCIKLIRGNCQYYNTETEECYQPGALEERAFWCFRDRDKESEQG